MAYKDKKYRALEIIPGALVWATLILVVIFSFTHPLWVVYFILAFDLYWLFRVFHFVFYCVISWRKYRAARKIDWAKKVAEMEGSDEAAHLIFLPTYKESYEVVRETIKSLAGARYPAKKMIIVLAGEERDKENFTRIANSIGAEFAPVFMKFAVTVHPSGLPDEIPGKGSNLNFAGREVKPMVEALPIPEEKIIVSAFDIDTVVHPDYFSALTVAYLSHPNPTRSSYQPIAFYNNNIWDSPAIVRIAAFGTTFWLMSELMRPERLVTFSSHSMSWKALKEVGFWQKDIVSEDSRIFLQCFMHYNGDYSATPIHLPVSMDTVATERGYFESLKNLYKQHRRWAWGVENFPYLVWNFLRRPKIPLGKRIKYAWYDIEGRYTWATAAIFISVLGRLPFYFAKGEVRELSLFQNAPIILGWIMTAAMAGIFVSAALMPFILVRRPKGKSVFSWLVMFLQWALLPLTLIVFGSLPAIDAQTRLMLGKYLGFNVSPKTRGEVKQIATRQNKIISMPSKRLLAAALSRFRGKYRF
ncbi:glycosyltransferase family 2 protein [Candidatus Uhrbacteria bacterium]|nr:glycosyltransferase family 2 protein [Candidatus Uhrbacteria bacterium]